MPEILIVTGSPRKGGNTDSLIYAVRCGAERSGAQVEIVRLADLEISPCLGCGGCDKTGKCVINDDMQGVYERILQVERIVIASPIYFYSVSAQTKAFIDRLQALWSYKQLLCAQDKWQVQSQKKGFMVAVAATKGKRIFEGARLCVQYAYDASGFAYVNELLVRGMDGRNAVKDNPDVIAQAEEFGKRIAVC